MMKITAFVFLVITLVGVQAICPENTISMIYQYWDGSPPTDLMRQIKGQLTWITAPGFAENPETIKCGRTVIGSDALTVAYLIKYSKKVAPVLRTFTAVEEKQGTLTFYVNNKPTGTNVFVITLTSKLFTYFECNEKDDANGFAGLSAVNANTTDLENSEELKRDIDDAYNLLEELRLEPLKVVNADCDTCDAE